MHIEESTNVDTFSSRRQPAPTTAEKVLEELFILLEEYAPSWYTHEIHNRAVAALYKREW